MMHTSRRERETRSSLADRIAPLVSPKAGQLVAFGRSQGWDFPVLGQAAMPSEPERLGDWLIVPAYQDSSLVPARALKRVQSIYAAGLRPKGFVLVHEAPKLLLAPAQERPKQILRMPTVPPYLRSALKTASAALGVLATVLIAVTGFAALAAVIVCTAAVLAVPAFLVVTAAIVDPILVAVTADDYWIEIDRWWN